MRTLLPLAMLLMGTSLPTLAVGPGVVVPGQPVPDFALKTAGGDNQRLSEWRGEVVLLSFWAEWCGRCSEQLQELAGLQKQYAGRGVRIVTVNIDADSAVAREASARRPDLLVLHDGDQSVARQYDLGNLPLTVVVDPHGKVRYVHEKYRGGDAALYDEELSALLQE